MVGLLGSIGENVGLDSTSTEPDTIYETAKT